MLETTGSEERLEKGDTYSEITRKIERAPAEIVVWPVGWDDLQRRERICSWETTQKKYLQSDSVREGGERRQTGKDYRSQIIVIHVPLDISRNVVRLAVFRDGNGA